MIVQRERRGIRRERENVLSPMFAIKSNVAVDRGIIKNAHRIIY